MYRESKEMLESAFNISTSIQVNSCELPLDCKASQIAGTNTKHLDLCVLSGSYSAANTTRLLIYCTTHMHEMDALSASTHLIRGQVNTQVCHLLSGAHSASFLSCHEILISLRSSRKREMSSR